MNTITISKPDQPDGAASTMFKAPDNEHAARELFNFLAEYLQPGFVVELDANGRYRVQPSGEAPLPDCPICGPDNGRTVHHADSGEDGGPLIYQCLNCGRIGEA